MPNAPLRFCLVPACSQKVRSGRCTLHQTQLRHTRNTEAGHHWYRTARWYRLRDDVRIEEPFCRICTVRVTEEIDHIVPHQGNEELFFDRQNLQGLCGGCHGRKTRDGQ